MVKQLLIHRLTYYRTEIFERLWRFKLLIFFILAMVVPTMAFVMEIVKYVSAGLIVGSGYQFYFINLIIFQLIAMIWIGSQYDCLKIPDVEKYLRTLNISSACLFSVELIFILIINLPFIAFLILGAVSLAAKQALWLSITHLTYLTSSIIFLSICLIFSRAALVTLLLITNLSFIYFNSSVGPIIISIILLLLSYFVSINKININLKIKNIIPFSKLNISHFCPNIYLNLKSLFVWSKTYTACILGINFLALFIFVSYMLANPHTEKNYFGFLVMLNVIMYFCALLSYKLSETRHAYGSYFSLFYSQTKNYFFDLLSICIIAVLYFFITFVVGLYLGVSVLLMLKYFLIAILGVGIYMTLNRKFAFYGPILSLLGLVGILFISAEILI